MADLKRQKVEPDADQEREIFEKLESIQEEIEKLNDKASEEVLEIEKKYNALRRPLYKKRNEVLSKIPNFWPTTFLNHEMLSDLLDERDRDAMKYLTSVEVEDFEDVKTGYRIIMTFEENPFFTNKTLTKEFSYTSEGELEVIPSKINWKEGKDLTKREDEESEEDEGRKRSRDERDSFFKWFDPEDQEVELGDIIKEDLWPNPVKYYSEVTEEDGGDDGGEGDDDDDEDDGLGEGDADGDGDDAGDPEEEGEGDEEEDS